MKYFKRNQELTENPEELEKWTDDYGNVRRLMENVSSAFGFILILFNCHDLVIAIDKFEGIFRR